MFLFFFISGEILKKIFFLNQINACLTKLLRCQDLFANSFLPLLELGCDNEFGHFSCRVCPFLLVG